MARIAGVNIPENKHLEIALTHIFGIGKKNCPRYMQKCKTGLLKESF